MVNCLAAVPLGLRQQGFLSHITCQYSFPHASILQVPLITCLHWRVAAMFWPSNTAWPESFEEGSSTG